MIKLKNNKSINGMSEFALTQHYTRQYPNNIFYSEILSALGLSAPNFITYKINLNGDDWGLMLAEEQYSNKYFETRNKEYYPTIKLTNEDNSDLRRILYSKFGSELMKKHTNFLNTDMVKLKIEFLIIMILVDPNFRNKELFKRY